jgi:hypothetical protein
LCEAWHNAECGYHQRGGRERAYWDRCQPGDLKVARVPRVLLWYFGLDVVEQT